MPIQGNPLALWVVLGEVSLAHSLPYSLSNANELSTATASGSQWFPGNALARMQRVHKPADF